MDKFATSVNCTKLSDLAFSTKKLTFDSSDWLLQTYRDLRNKEACNGHVLIPIYLADLFI